MLPEYVKHIRHTRADMRGTAWCGADVRLLWTFQDLDHAAYNGMSEGRLRACPACVDAAVKALQAGKGPSEG